jgi:polysaccharide biosynthesis/export protein
MARHIAIAIAVVAGLMLAAGCAPPLPRPHANGGGDLPTSTAPAESAEKAEGYRLGPGDTVKITVYRSPDLTTEADITRAGTVNFPLIGRIKLSGLTRTEGERLIAERLRKGQFIKRPHVNVLVTQYRSQQVSVFGEVNKPGMYPLERTSTVTDVLAAAGGISAKGSKVVTLIRPVPTGAAKRYQVDLNTIFGNGDASHNVKVMRGDIIHVPPTPVFYIYGEVRQPGAYPLAADMTIHQALSVGGGLTLRGTERGINVDRKDADGTVTTYSAQLTDVLEPDDVVHVPESWF